LKQCLISTDRGLEISSLLYYWWWSLWSHVIATSPKFEWGNR
jgi:hypothetical protein